jgi:hypothetical protein
MKLTTERLNMCIILRNHETALVSLNPPMPSQFSCASYARWRKTCAALCHAYRQWPMANGQWTGISVELWKNIALQQN